MLRTFQIYQTAIQTKKPRENETKSFLTTKNNIMLSNQFQRGFLSVSLSVEKPNLEQI